MNAWAQSEGQPGLGYIFWREGRRRQAGPIAKNIGPDAPGDRRSSSA
jgi:aspartyl-tRNA synthetase